MTNTDGLQTMPVATKRSIAVTLIVLGIVFLAGGIAWDLNGGPAFIHTFTWVGGAIFAWGVVTLVSTRRSALK
ncbi:MULTISPECIES: hypothetical protein [Herbiconiux]|jgi:hypothetical protein|uniref:DUF2530 domain-containing protein n=1 Tax=Herbiconiux flava TaxID=881268 RepID=A0A852SQ33_9MICO|nr:MULTISPECIES: hypothetical protein [Herbiconiux]NQX33250.1 hypothetical protein [Herbiconiux sp. VKM Ac-2851]NYD70947.1 hypothetical protein [Herbiconiux flava]GLK19091.1 hypothetical protein GCM10017602_35730 [Herbiconiux flava]